MFIMSVYLQYRYTVRAPFIVYADFEALVIASDRTGPDRGHKSFDYETQIPCSVAYYVVSCFPQFTNKFDSHDGPDCVDWFLDRMLELQKEAIHFYYDEKRIIMTPTDEQTFKTSPNCWICGKDFDAARNDRVKDHDHITGMYRGAAHSRCNIRAQRTCKVPIFFHNLRGYDGHFITRALARYPGLDINVIGQGMEKYLTLSQDKFPVFK